MTRLMHFSMACLAAGGLCSVAQADSVTTTYDGSSPAHNVTINEDTHFSGRVRAGQYNFTGATGAISGDFHTFCLEMQAIRPGDTPTYDVVELTSGPSPKGPGAENGPMSGQSANYLRELWANRHDDATDTSLALDQQRDNAAAFQVAVWELVYDTDLSLTDSAGGFHVSDAPSDVFTLADDWLNELDGEGPMQSNLRALSSESYQDQLVVTGPTDTPAVPTPSAMGGAGALLALIGVARWRRPKAG